MHPSRTPAAALPLCLLLAASLAAAGCRISNDNKNGNDNVKVATPFGGLQIKTNEAAAQASVGLPTYPGATLTRKDESKSDSVAADINMSFGSFQMRVKAVSYRTPDSPDKVQAFYRNALRRYGDIIECVNDHPVGKPDHTADGLTCDKDNHHDHAGAEDKFAKVELKTGSEKHQHVVSIEHEGAGTKFGLVALDLPGNLSIGNDGAKPED